MSTLPPSPTGRWYCDACSSRYGAPGECPRPACDSEPLLDLGDPEVGHMLEDADSARARKRLTLVSSVALVPAACLGLWGAFILGTRWGATPGILLAAVAITVGMRRFPARERTPEDIEEVQARVAAARAAEAAAAGRIPIKAKPKPTGPTEPCSGCGRAIPAGTALIGEHGLLCATCLGEEEVEQLEAQAAKDKPSALDLLL